MLWIAAVSVSRVPSSTLTCPDKKNDLGVMSGLVRLGLDAGGVFGTLPVPGGCCPLPPDCALSARAREKTKVRRIRVLNMAGPPCFRHCTPTPSILSVDPDEWNQTQGGGLLAGGRVH